MNVHIRNEADLRAFCAEHDLSVEWVPYRPETMSGNCFHVASVRGCIAVWWRRDEWRVAEEASQYCMNFGAYSDELPATLLHRLGGTHG